jgi:hypothetical protein
MGSLRMMFHNTGQKVNKDELEAPGFEFGSLRSDQLPASAPSASKRSYKKVYSKPLD